MMTHHLLSACDLVVGRPAKRRKRRATLAGALREVNKVGAAVKAATIAPDGSVTLTFGEPDVADAPGNELDKWMAKRNAH
jgi:hypothetical protein